MRVVYFILALEFFVLAQTCVDCHAQEAKKWRDSHHRHAMHVVKPEVVLGDFSGVKVKEGPYEAIFSSGNGQYFVELEGVRGDKIKAKVSHTFGWDPLQQYLVEFEPSGGKGLGRMQVIPWAWDTQKKQWLHLFIDEKPRPGEPLHWTGWGQNWNHMCADCHTTGYRKNFDEKSLTFSSTFTHDTVHCTACHEPHGAMVKGGAGKYSGTSPRDLDKSKQRHEMNSCGPCHSLRAQITPGKKPKDSFEDHYRLMGLGEENYHADGQIKGEVYVMGSFLQSKMYRAGVRCSHCHDPHSLELRAPQRQVCFQCHDQSKYASPSHHRHQEGGAGSNCLECHMPESTYMRVDPRRDHSFKSPRPDLSMTFGVPNACTGCHLQEGRQHQFRDYQKWLAAGEVEHPLWKKKIKALDQEMAKAMSEWGLGKESPGLVELIVKAREGALVPSLEALVHQEDQFGPITRASMVSLLAEPSLETESRLSSSEDAMVREASLRHLDLEGLQECLNDPVRTVRLTALQYVLEHTRSWEPKKKSELLTPILHEDLRLQLDANRDQAGAHLFYGQVQEAIGKVNDALRSYENGIRVQSEWAGPRQALANLLPPGLRATRLRKEEIELLKENLKVAPENHRLHYTLGLLYYQIGDLSNCIRSMRAFLKADPSHYNASAFVIQLEMRRGNRHDALKEARRALLFHPGDPWLRSLLNGPIPR